MMGILRNGTLVQDDWQQLADEDALPASGNVLVSLQRWVNEQEQLVNHQANQQGKVGVVINGGDDFEAHVEALCKLPLIALSFPSFSDGRNYSSARLLRERYGFDGELRAIGNILRDQLFYLSRCGVDAFALEAGKDAQDACEGLRDFDVVYQGAADQRDPVNALRRPTA